MLVMKRLVEIWYVLSLLLVPISSKGAIVRESLTESDFSPHAIWVSLPDLDSSLPIEFLIKENVPWMKVVNNPVHPRRLDYSKLVGNMVLIGDLQGQDFLNLLDPSAKYSYVLTSQHLILAEISRNKKTKFFSKHVFLSGFANSVRYAGEAWLSLNEGRDMTIDNNSGTYKPVKTKLNDVAILLSSLLNIDVVAKVRKKN